jgi:AraC-like DNA-binding protein
MSFHSHAHLDDAASYSVDDNVSAKPFSRVTFDTAQVAPEHRFDAWRSILALTHEIDGAPDGFDARLTSTSLGTLVASEMSASPQSVARPPQRVRRDGLDHVVLHLTSSDFDVEMGDARFRVPSGSITVNTLSRPFRRSAAAEQGSIVLSLSRDLVAGVLPEPEVFHGHVLQGPLGHLFGEHMRSLVRHAHLVTAAEADGLARATAQLLAAGLEPARSRIRSSRVEIEAAVLLRCKRYVERHLGSPTLTPDAICREIGLSRSTLFRLFRSSGGISSYIRMQRLRAAHNALAAPDQPRVSDVAHRYGFSDAAAFSRAFRTTFGTSPRDVGGDPRDKHQAENSIFAAWMQKISNKFD